MKKALWVLVGFVILSSLPIFAVCPSADLTGDCHVDLKDFALLSSQWLGSMPDLDLFVSQWLTGTRLPQDMTLIPAGTFQMGDSIGDSINEDFPRERPVHTVNLDSFAMGKYEITNGQYCAFLNSAYPSQLKVVDGVVYASSDTPNSFPYCSTSSAPTYPYFDNHSQIAFSNNTFSVRWKGLRGGRDMSKDPMVCVYWYGAVAYCNWRSEQEDKEPSYNLSTWNCDFSKKGYRLATEAEWEYAARGGLSGKRFPWGDTITQSMANYNSFWDSGKPYFPYDLNPTPGYHPIWNEGISQMPYTSPVGSFSANGYGLYDMSGNVFEWCNDWYSDTYYSSSPQLNPTGPPTSDVRVLRGGCWASGANCCRVSIRVYDLPYSWGDYYGFRVVLDYE